VIQVFPDEFHLHTLDQFLSATARLHPHVNVKAIVIGLMDRLSAYAAREAEALTPEQKQQNEETAMTALLERLQLAKDKPPAEPQQHQNGESSDAASVAPSETTTAVESEADSQADTVNGDRPAGRGIPEDIKLFEIFNEQVQSLVKLQRLPLADAVALMVSLANLALYVLTTARECD
jgi:vacuolar protein sorting-associated protein 35